MSKRRKITTVLVALLGMVLVGLGIHFKPSSPRLAELGNYRVSTNKETFEVDLTSNSSAGYSWVAGDVNSEAIILEGVTYHTYPSKPDTVGSDGYSQLTGKVIESGKQSFKLTYCQDWDGGEKGMTYRVAISSTKNGVSKVKLAEMSE